MGRHKKVKGRPLCLNEGCRVPVMLAYYKKSGDPVWKTLCEACTKSPIKARGGIKPHKKNYCENIDGRLGFKCTSTIVDTCQLDLDHIDGNHFNNIPKNVQTICKNCHSVKSKINGDTKGFKY